MRLADIRQTGHVVRNLVTVGALATWILANQKLVIFTVDSKLNPQPGDTLISLVEPVEANEE